MRIGIRIDPVTLKKARRDISKLTPKVITDKNGHRRKVYITLGIPISGKDRKVEGKEQKPVQHDGEFVLTSEGSKDFGETTPETGLQPGKIRLRTGKQEGVLGDYGEKHIERPDQLAQLRDNGYYNARDLVEEVAKDYDSIYKGKGNGFILGKQYEKRDRILYVEMKPSSEGDFYDVTSALITKKSYLRNKNPLWVRPTAGYFSGNQG